VSRKKKPKAAVPEEILAEGSGPVADAPEAGDAGDVEALAAAASEALADAPAPAPEPEPEPAHEPDPEPEPDVLEAAPPDALEEISDEEAAEMGAALPTSAASMDAGQLKYLVEALVFASDKPITVLRLRQLTRVSDIRRLEQALADVAEDHKDRGIVLQQVSGGYQFRTRTQFSAWVQQLIAGRPVRLSRAQLETLAIVAYRQPITRPEIDEIRGVDSSATLKLLLDRTLIRILGKKEEVGRPMLYGTTKEFLDFFSLGDLRELPTLREYSELTDESRRVMTDELGIDPDAPAPDVAEEPVEAEPEAVSIDDMVASYNVSMEVASVEMADESGAFVTHATRSSLDALAARRMSAGEAVAMIETADVGDVAMADVAMADVAMADVAMADVATADVDGGEPSEMPSIEETDTTSDDTATAADEPDSTSD
jgi:segregation and condensation protein B